MDPRSSTVDGVLARSARRTPDRVALHFADRTWTYRELDDAVTRAAGYLGELGCRAGDRVAAYGRNSDAYLLAFLGLRAARRGPRADQLRAHGRGARPTWSSSRAAACCSSTRRWRAPSTRWTRQPKQVVPLRDARGLAARARPHRRAPGADQHGRRHRPRPAALHVGHDVAAQGRDDDPPRAGARVRLVRARAWRWATATTRCTRCRCTTRRACTCFLHALPDGRRGQPPHGGARHPGDPAPGRGRPASARCSSPRRCGCRWPTTPDFGTRDLSSLRKAFYGASIMPGPVLDPAARARCRSSRFYNCFGQSEIGPLATVLQPEEHDERPESCGRAGAVRRAAGDRRPTGDDVEPGGTGEVRVPLAAALRGLLGQARGDRRGVPRRLVPLRATWCASTRRATSPSSTASRT